MSLVRAEVEHRFGGPWTEKKLAAIRKYLDAYLTIFAKGGRADYYATVYVDAFAGTGRRAARSKPKPEEGQREPEAAAAQGAFAFIQDVPPRRAEKREDPKPSDEDAFHRGSVHVVLGLSRPFRRYFFIDKKPAHVAELRRLVHAEFPELESRCEIEQAEANAFLTKWCSQQDWRRTRAVVFLDPYGMAVSWTTIEALARTRGVDLWVLLPAGMGINRVLTRDGLPTPRWGKALTRVFGTNEWVNRFYARMRSESLYGTAEWAGKIANINDISDFYIERLRTVFPHVADLPGVLSNSKNSPMFMLCFASHNATGLKIADHILAH